MKSDKSTETYLSKYIKIQNPYNQGKVKIKTRKSLLYRIINEIEHKKNNDFIEKRATNRSTYKQEQNTAKNKRDLQKSIKDKSINNSLNKYI